MAKYDAKHIERFYDDYGEREWERLTQRPDQVVNFHIHGHFLQRFVKPGDRVLEAGAGPGRFTLELVQLGAKVTVGDISPRQLELNQQKMREAGVAEQIAAWHPLDITDLSQYPSESFDSVVCYGGPLSYVFEHADTALNEMLRVTRPGGFVLLSVMSLLGSTRATLPPILGLARVHGVNAVDQVTATGDLLGDINNGHRCHMFRWSELKAMLQRQGCTIEAAAASGCLAPGQADALQAVMENEPDLWERFLAWELDLCQEDGAIDGGTHIIAVVRRTN
jgi:SAM-dependent methyltransferase